MTCKSTLDNGVRVVSEAVAGARSVAVGVWIDCGSRQEPEHLAGICHFVEHMVFKGTKRRRMHQIASRMEAVGGYLNAFTSKEHTCFHARALDTHLDRAVETTCDLAANPVFPEREIANERQVVLEEMKMYEDAPEEFVFDRFESAVYGDHPIGRPVIGYPRTVGRLNRANLTDYVSETFTADRIVVAAAGRLKHATFERAVSNELSSLHAGKSVEPAQAPAGYEPGTVVVDKPIQQAHVILGRPGIGIHSPDRAAVGLLNTILGAGMSSRLVQNIRERHGFCYNIYSFANAYSDCGDLGVYMGVDASKVDRAQRLVFRELKRMANEPVSARTLKRAKQQAKGAMVFGLERMNNRMMRVARQELYFGRFVTLDQALQELEAVTVNDIQEAARTYLLPDTFSRILLLPKA